MDVATGFFQNAKSGSNYIRFLLYTTTQSNDSIKIQYSIDPTGAWTDSDFADAGGLEDTGTYTYEDIPCAIRVVGSRVHFFYNTYIGGIARLRYGYSDDDGETFTLDNATSGEDGYNTPDRIDILDIIELNGTPYGILNEIAPNGHIYDLTDFSLIINLSGKKIGPGFLDEVNDLYTYPMIRFSLTGTRIFTFDGTATQLNEDTGFDKIGDTISSILLKKGNLRFLILGAFGASNDLILLQYGDDPWSEFDFGGQNYDLKVGWEEDRYEPRFIHVGGNVDDLYYISEGGSLIKINEDATETVLSGIGQFLHPYEVTFEELDVYDSKLYEEHLKSSILTVESSSQLFTQGLGIVYRDLNSVKVFVGNVEIIDTDLDGQFVKFSTPAKDDLEREITVSFIAQKSSEILQFILDNKCKFLHGIIAATTNTFTIKWDNTKIKEIIQWAENEEFKIFYWDDEGDSTFDSGIIGSTTLDENSGDMTEIKIKDLGRKFNGILLRGGLKGDGTIARLLRSDQKTSGIQLNIFTIDVPQMIDDTDLPGFEMYDYGTQVLANLNSAFRNLRMVIIEKGHLQIGNRGIVTSQEYGISSEDYTFFKNIYYPEEGNTKIDNSYNGLYFIVDSKESLPESNREVLGQVAEELNNLSHIGSIFYLDSNVSDIAGYKKMFLTYASDIEEDIPVADAVDGDLIEEFATEPNEPGITELIGGIYSTHIHASKTSGVGTKDVAIYFELYKRASGGGETLLGTSHSSEIFSGLDNLLSTHVHIEDEIILITDRIIVKYYVSVTGNGAPPDIEMHIQGDTTSRFVFPFNIPTSAATDVNAIHDNVANEITVITPKTTPVSADEFLLEDSAASFVKKAITFANLKTAVQTTHLDTTAIHKATANEITAITPKTTLVNADELLLEDSENLFNKKAVTFANLKSGIRYTNSEAVSAVEAVGLALANSKSIKIDPYPASSGGAAGLIVALGTDGAANGSCMYMGQDGEYDIADADDATKMPCSGIKISNGLVLLFGVIRNDGYNFNDGAGNVGDPVYVGTDGSPTTIRPNGSGDQIQRIGIAIAVDYLLFMPSMDVGELA